MTSHWGEFESPEVQNEEVIPAEIVKLFIMKAMQQDPFRTPLPVQGPSPEAPAEADPLSSEIQGLEMDDRVIHTIKLLQHAKDMYQLLDSAKKQAERLGDTQMNAIPPALDIPDHPLRPSNYRMNYPLQYMDKEFSDFTSGKCQETPQITTQTARLLLRKAVAALTAHAGYDTTTSGILSTFADVVEEYIKKMTGLLRVAVDQGANAMATGFPDAMERVFHEMDIGSVRCLHDYYQQKVIKYHESVLEECKALNQEYTNITMPKKMEEPDDSPEIHFLALGEGDGVDELQPSLEQGFQMLHSLEHLQNLDSQEEEVVHCSDSPMLEAAATVTVDVQSHLLAKKRKRM